MEILEVNRNTLSNLYEQFPDSLGGLALKGKYLMYNGEKVDISEFNVNDLLGGDTAFASSLSSLSAEDIFKIIRLHATFLASKKKEDKNEEKLEIIQEENPLMQSVSIVRKTDGVITKEYFNIVDSSGKDHLFTNDRNVDIFTIYETLKGRSNGNITPDELIEAINRKLYQVNLEQARDLSESAEVSEDFANKMNTLNDPYRDDKSVRVYGNEQSDIAVVADDRGVDKHEVVTFDKNEFGDLVTERHHQNVTDEGVTETSTQDTEDTKVDEKNKDVEIVEVLIPEEEFYRLLNSDLDLTEDERKSVNLFYAYLGDLVIYEDYLLPELMNLLNRFRAYVYGLQYENDESMELNKKQEEAIEKANEFELKKNDSELTKDPNKVKEEVQKLTLKYNQSDSENKGTISTLLVIVAIIVVAIIMMIVTLNVIY